MTPLGQSYLILNIKNREIFPTVLYLRNLEECYKDGKISLYASPWGMDLMMSESPGSVMERVHTLKYFPQAVPNSMLFPV